ncbi:glucosidase 2 subunit beta isoform X2 [Phalaenopsis equestris]|uniref:glucosidase 2 subunit beta isoform X2 n=1 Tax=Phalaenopsis equestris TaxID=78828 RepID=UPI0009E380F3|nr:glucosidase 2 subunit beta isoform X2 [Phalaenopsis equestris]
MGACLRFALLFTIFFLVWVSGSISIPNKQSLGIDPQDLSYYKSNVIKCKDGSKKFTKELLNDDFCDCPDGTDEPGTSACPEGKFYCQNAGHVPVKIFSSRVNDGICDCCDGSDEYHSKANCTNTCWEAGKAARGKLKKKIETFKEGLILRKEIVEKAKQAYVKDEEELAKLKNDEKVLKELVQKLREQKERVDKLEEEERLKKEKEEKRLREEEEKSKEQEKKTEETEHDDTIDNHDQDGSKSSPDIEIESGDDSRESKTASHEAVEQHAGEEHDDILESSDDFSEVGEISPNEDQVESVTTEELSREELGRLVASRWTGEGADQTADKIRNVEEDLMDQKPYVAHEHKGFTSETDDDRAKEEEEEEDDDDADSNEDSFHDDRDDEFADDHADLDGSYNTNEYEQTDPVDTTEASSSSWLGKIQQTVQNVLQAFNFFKTPVNVSDATHIRKEYDDASSKLSKVQSRISSLTEKLKHDFGKEKEFYSFHDQCFESKQNKYVYKICPFKRASQDEGYSSTRLGSWENFEESYRVMVFSNGEKCWNGPDRSLKVRLRCGLKNEISEVDEPSRCEYVALMSTPAVCLEDKLKELEKKLDQLNAPKGHDEL